MTNQVVDGAPWIATRGVEGPRLPDGSYGFADRSTLDEPPAPVEEAYSAAVRLLHTWTPRALTSVGAVAVLAVVVAEVLTALRGSDWKHPRPLLEPRLGLAVAVLLLGGLWWQVAATTNARRVTPRRVVGPAVAAAYVVPVAVWFGVDRFVDGDVRRWAWVAWAALVLVVHCAVAVSFRAGSAAMGRTNSHLEMVAGLPLAATAIGVAAVFQEFAVFALPMAAALAAWAIVELWQAMNEWDGLCRERSLLRRDLPQISPVFASGHGGRGSAPSTATVMAARPVMPADEHSHHTTTPRAMVLASFLLGLSMPAWVVLLERKGHVVLAGRDSVADAEGRKLLATLLVGMLGAYAVGWLWWSAAAAANASNRARYAISPLLAPLGYFVVVGVGALVPILRDRVRSEFAPLVSVIGAVIAVIAHFGVLRAYRRTAEAIGASVAAWTRVIALPWMAAAFSLLLAFFGQMLNETAFAWVLGGAWVLFYLAYAVSFYQAMAGFDRSCTGRHLTHADLDGIPDFLKKRPRPADMGS